MELASEGVGEGADTNEDEGDEEDEEESGYSWYTLSVIAFNFFSTSRRRIRANPRRARRNDKVLRSKYYLFS